MYMFHFYIQPYPFDFEGTVNFQHRVGFDFFIGLQVKLSGGRHVSIGKIFGLRIKQKTQLHQKGIVKHRFLPIYQRLCPIQRQFQLTGTG